MANDVSNVEGLPTSEANPYSSSIAVAKFRGQQAKNLPLRLAFVDIDATLTGNPPAALKVRKKLEEQGYVLVFVTSRTPEMAMSEGEFEKSQKAGFKRVAPHLGTENGKRVPAFADQIEDFAGLYDPDAVAATTGSDIALRQENGGYEKDLKFERLQQKESEDWRKETLPIVRDLLSKVDPQKQIAKLAPIDEAGNFEAGNVDVFAPDTRIQINFDASSVPVSTGTGSTEGGVDVVKEKARMAFEKKEEFRKQFEELKFGPQEYRQELVNLDEAKLSPQEHEVKVAELKRKYNLNEAVMAQLVNIRLTDDSNPDKGRFAFYVTPNKGHKGRAVEAITSNIVKELGIKQDQLETLMIGDSFPDVDMSRGATGTKATFLIVGGSRLTNVFTDPNVSGFAGEGMGAVKNRLTGENGRLEFRMPLFGKRNVVVGGVAYPGTEGPETILAYLNSPQIPVKN